MGNQKKLRTAEIEQRYKYTVATMAAIECIEEYEHLQLLKRLFIFQFTGEWTAKHPQIGVFNG